MLRFRRLYCLQKVKRTEILSHIVQRIMEPHILILLSVKPCLINILTQPTKLIADGSCYEIRINSSQLGFTFDINGAEKGPNALGHDIFSFWMDDNDYLQPIKQSMSYTNDDIEAVLAECEETYGDTGGIPLEACKLEAYQKGSPCNKTSTQRGNGLGCSWYAMHDVCPDDDTKGYWECLP